MVSHGVHHWSQNPEISRACRPTAALSPSPPGLPYHVSEKAPVELLPLPWPDPHTLGATLPPDSEHAIRMIEVQLAPSHLQDRHVFTVPVDPRMIVVLEDGEPGDGSDDGNAQEDGPEGSIQGPHVYPLLPAGPAFVPTLDALHSPETVTILL